jgi:hypothetical protein
MEFISIHVCVKLETHLPIDLSLHFQTVVLILSSWPLVFSDIQPVVLDIAGHWCRHPLVPLVSQHSHIMLIPLTLFFFLFFFTAAHLEVLDILVRTRCAGRMDRPAEVQHYYCYRGNLR